MKHISIEFIKDSKGFLQNFDYNRINPDIEKPVKFKKGQIIDNILDICDCPDNPKNSIIELDVFKDDPEDIAFATYYDVPKDSYKTI